MLNAEFVTQKIQLHRLKKKKSLFTGFYNNIQRPIKRERERERKKVGEAERDKGRVKGNQEGGREPERDKGPQEAELRSKPERN